MANNNFLDNVVYVGSTLAISGDAIAIGSTDVGAKSIIFSNSTNAGHFAWNPSAVRTINLPDTNGTVMLTSQAILSMFAGTTRITSGEVSFSNGSNVSFGINGQTITASVATSLTNIHLSAGTTSNSGSAFVFSNSNNFSFGLNGSTITGSYTVPSTAGLLSAINVSAGTTSNNGSAFVFSNSNNVSFGLNGSTVTATISVPAQTNQTVGLYALGNTTGQSSSSTFDARTVSFSGAGIASVGYSGNAVVISVPTGAPSPVNFSAGTTSSNLGSVVFSNSNGVSFGLNGATITASVNAGGGAASYYALGNTTQNSSTTLSVVSFNALGAMTMGYINGSVQVSAPPVTSVVGTGGIIISTNGSTLSISGPNYAYYEPTMLLVSGSTTFLPGLGSLYFEPLTVPANISGGHINRLVSFSGTTGILPGSSTSFSSASTGSRSLSLSYVNTIALYSLGAGTNSTRLESLWSNTFSLGLAQSLSVSSGGATTLTVTHAGTMSYIASIDSVGGYTTSSISGSTTRSSASGAMAVSAVTGGISSILNMLSGPWVMPIGFNTTIQPGNYWFAHVYSSSITTGGTSVVTQSVLSQVNMIGLQAAATLSHHIWGQTASTSGSVPYPGAGVYSVATNGIPSTVAFSDIRNVAAVRQYFNFVNSTI